MKNFILLTAVIGFASGASAIDNYEFEGFVAQGLSQNGRYAVSSALGNVIFVDLTTLDANHWMGNDESIVAYGVGGGHCISNDGRLVGYTTTTGTAAYTDFNSGKWTALQCPTDLTNLAEAITPDGRVICGTIHNPASTSAYEDKIMSVPAVWYLLENGVYSPAQQLPYPELDWTGRVPQYVRAIDISDDGKTIIGQIRDYSGFCCMPIVYKNIDGEWTYELVNPELANPDNLEFPPYPGDGPMMPSPEAYMTSEQKEAYEQAYKDWAESENIDYSKEPFPDQYMGEEELANYYAALEEWNKENELWSEKWWAWNDVFSACLAKAPGFMFNAIWISNDGKRAISYNQTEIDEETYQARRIAGTYVFNLEDGSYYVIEDPNGFEGNSIAADYSVFGCSYINGNSTPAVALPGEKTAIPLEQYISGIDPQTGDWMLDNMARDGIVRGGFTYVTPQKDTILTYCENNWDFDSSYWYYSWLLKPAADNSGVASAGTPEFSVQILSDGTLKVNGEAATVYVYTTDGKLVFSANCEGEAATGLDKGIYLVRAVSESGRTVTAKAAF